MKHPPVSTRKSPTRPCSNTQKPPSGRPAVPMWIESGVAAGPSDAGGGWLSWMAACKAKPPYWAQRESLGIADLAWEGQRVRRRAAKGGGGCKATLSGFGDLRAMFVEFNELSRRWPFAFYLVILVKKGVEAWHVEGRAQVLRSGRRQRRSD